MSTQTPTQTESLKSKCDRIRSAWYLYLVNKVDDSCYQTTPDGELYISLQIMLPLERQVKQIYIDALENEGNYPMPPKE